MFAALQRGIRETVEGLPGPFWILFAGSLVNRLGSFVSPFLVLWLTGPGGLDAASAGLLASLYGAGTLLAALAGGVLADRIGRKSTMLLGLCGGGAAMLGLGLSRSLLAIAALTFLVALFSDLVRPALQAAVADVVPPAARARAYGLLYWGVNLGFAIAPIVAGFMATRSWLLLFVADACTTWAFAAIVLVGIRETRPVAEEKAGSGEGIVAGLVVALRDRDLVLFALLAFLLALVFFQVGAALPLDLLAHGVSEARFGLLISLNGLGIIVLQVPLLRWLSRFPPGPVLAASSLLVGAGFGLTGVVTTEPLWALSILVWTLGEIGNGPLVSSVVAQLSPPSLRGRYAGLFSMAMGFAHMTAPALGGLVFARFGGSVVWGGCVAISLVVATGHLLAAGPRALRLSPGPPPAPRLGLAA